MQQNNLKMLCEFICNLKYEDLPKEVVEKTKKHLLDTLGAALAGTCSAEFNHILSLKSGLEVSSVWGTDIKTSPKEAAFMNGVASHVFELDDSGGCDHTGAVVIPALFAALQQSSQPIAGKELITAVVAGYEVGRRILEAFGGYDAHNKLGWHSTGTCGTLAAAAAVAKLWKLDVMACRDAITLATSFSSGLWAFIHDGSQAKKVHAGRASEGGFLAAELAANGISGPSQVFEDVWGGFFRTFNHGLGDVSKLSERLGKEWKIMRAVIKPYASCRGAHSSIDAFKDILKETQKKSEDIKSIHISMSSLLFDMCGKKESSKLAPTQMSLPYAVVAQWIYGSAGLESYEKSKRNSHLVAQAFDYIEVKIDPNMLPLNEPNLTIKFKDEAEFTKTVPFASGSLQRPLSDEDFDFKFSSLSQMSVSKSDSEKIGVTVKNLEVLSDCTELIFHMSPARTQIQVFN